MHREAAAAAAAAAAVVAARPRPPPLPAAAALPLRHAGAHQLLLHPTAHHFLYERGQPLLGEEEVRDEIFGGAARALPEIALRGQGRAREQAAALAQRGGPALAAAVERLARLSPQPTQRLSLAEARELVGLAAAQRAAFPDIADDDVWVAAVQWPASKLARLELGVRILSDFDERLDRLRAALDAAAEFAAGGAPIAGDPLHARTCLPVAVARNLMQAAEWAAPALLCHRKEDGGCCFIDGGSSVRFADAIVLMRRAASVVFEALVQQCERLRARDGSRFDSASRLDQVRRSAEFLSSSERRVVSAQLEHAVWWGRRAAFGNAEFELLANDPRGKVSGDATFVADGEGHLSSLAPESADILDALREIGSQRALIRDRDGGILSRGLALGAAATELVAAVKLRATTVDDIAVCLSEYEKAIAGGDANAAPQQAALDESLPQTLMPHQSTLLPADLAGAGERNASDHLQSLMRANNFLGAVSLIKAESRRGPSHKLALVVHSSAGLSPMAIAISKGSVACVRALILEAGVDVASSVTVDGRTSVLHAIAAKGGAAALAMLDVALESLRRSHTDETERRGVLNALSSAGLTCMLLAARSTVNSRAEAAAMLLALVRAGADPCLRGASVRTPMQTFAVTHCAALPGALQSSEADVAPSFLPLERFCLSPLFSDCTIVAVYGEEAAPASPGATLPAHRIVLASASPVFSAMLEGEFAESRGSCEIRLHGCSEKNAERLLRFAYCGSLDLAPGDVRAALDLLRVASRYGLEGLSAALQSFAAQPPCLKRETAVAVWAEAGDDAPRLRAAAARFVLENYDLLLEDGPDVSTCLGEVLEWIRNR